MEIYLVVSGINAKSSRYILKAGLSYGWYLDLWLELHLDHENTADDVLMS